MKPKNESVKLFDLPGGRSLFFLRMRIVPKEGCVDIVESGDHLANYPPLEVTA
jgi:hypothetical protein